MTEPKKCLVEQAGACRWIAQDGQCNSQCGFPRILAENTHATVEGQELLKRALDALKLSSDWHDTFQLIADINAALASKGNCEACGGTGTDGGSNDGGQKCNNCGGTGKSPAVSKSEGEKAEKHIHKFDSDGGVCSCGARASDDFQ